MAYQIIPKKGGRGNHGRHHREATPAATITKQALLRLNTAAFELLGRPRFVIFAVDSENGMVGIRASNEETDSTYTVSSRSGTYIVGCKALCRHYDIDYSETRKFKAYMESNLLVFKVKG